MHKLDSKQLFDLIKPFGYVSKETQDVIIDYLNMEDNTSVSYQLKNDDVIRNLLAFICIDLVYRNISNGGIVPIETLTIGQHINFSDGKTYIYDGKDSFDERYVKLLPLKKTKNSYDRIIPVDKIENEITLPKKDSKRTKTDAKAFLAQDLGIENYSRTNENKLVIIAPKKRIEDLICQKITLAGKEFYLGQIISSTYLNSNGSFEDLVHTNKSEDPAITFSSSLDAVLNYFEAGDEDAKEEIKVIAFEFGDHVTLTERIGLIGLKDYCEESSIPFGFFSSISYLMDEDLITEVVNRCGQRYTQQCQDEFNLSSVTVKQNEQLQQNLKVINNYLQDIQDDESLQFLSYSLKKIEHLMLSGVRKGSADVGAFSKNSPSTLSSNVELALNEINSNRYCVSQRNKIIGNLKNDSETLLVVMDDLLEVYKADFSNYTNVHIVSMSNKELDLLADKAYQQVLIVNPNARYLKKWLLSQICPNFVVIMPSGNIGFFKKFIYKQLKLIQTLNSKKLDVIENGLKATLQNVKSKEKKEQAAPINMLDNIIAEEEKEEELQSEKEKNAAHSDWRITLNNDKEYKETSYFQPYIVDEAGVLRRVTIRQLKPQTKIVQFELDNVRELITLKGMDEKFYEAYKKDNYWKNKLRTYAETRRMNPVQIKQKMSEIGYKKWSVDFFKSWLNPEISPFVPRDDKFILNVGKLTKDNSIIDNYTDYYNSSKVIKKIVHDYKERHIKLLVDQKYSPTKASKYALKVHVYKVEKIERQG